MKRILAIATTLAIGVAPAFAQKQIEVYPDRVTVNAGIVYGGGLDSIFESDNNYLVVGQLRPSLDPVQIEIEGRAGLFYSENRSFILETCVKGLSGGDAYLTQVVQFYNYIENRWVAVTSTNMIDPFDHRMRLPVDLKQFISQETNTMMVRVTWYPSRMAGSENFRIGIDWSCWMRKIN